MSVEVAAGRPEQADAWVETYLKGNDLAPDPADDGSGKSVLFDGKSTATATAIDTAVAAGQLANLEGGDSARAHITTDSVARIVSRVLDAAKTPPPATQPATDDPEQKGVLEADSDGIATSAKITFKSKDDGHSLGDLEFTVHLGPDGTLKQFEVDQTLIKGKLSDGMSRMRSKLLGMGALMPLEIEATLSGNATNDVTGDSQHTMFNTINVQLKGEIDASFGNAKTGAVFAHLKFGASFGTGGFAPSIGFEFPLPEILR